MIRLGCVPAAGQLPWLDTAALDMIYTACEEWRICTITRPGCVYILGREWLVSIAFLVATRRWRVSIDTAHRVRCCRRVFKEEQWKNLWRCLWLLVSVLKKKKKRKKDKWNIACSRASKNPSHRSKSLLRPPNFCVSLLAGSPSCVYSQL